MKIALIGRTEALYNTALMLLNAGHSIVAVITSKHAPEYRRTSEDFELLARTCGSYYGKGSVITMHYDNLVACQPDIGISMNYTGILPQSVIDLFPFGVLNAHGGDLPRYRGNACQAWAILNGEDRIGLCIHKMIGDELDSGDIIAREYLPIDHNTKVGFAWDWIVERVPYLMSEAVKTLEINPLYVLERQSDSPTPPLRCYPRTPEDGRIDWNSPSIHILRLINASNKPYPGAYCALDGVRLTVWHAELLGESEDFLAIPGQVLKIGNGHIDVACLRSKIRIRTVEYLDLVSTPDTFLKSIRKRLQ